MCMTFALGTCSGAHFNPAVTIAIVAARRDKCSPKDAGIYIATQLVAGIAAAFTYILAFVVSVATVESPLSE